MIKMGKIQSISEYIVIILLILEFNTPFSQYGIFVKIIYYIPIISIFLLLLLKGKKIQMKFWHLLLFLGSIIPFLNVQYGAESTYIRLFMLFLPLSILYFSNYEEERNVILYKYTNVILIICCVSLFFYIIGSTLNLISPTAYVPVFWGEQRIYPTYFYLYFEAQNSFFLGNEYIRNCGIFNEAPMYNMALCIALAIELFLREKKRKIVLCILGVTIITTFSTTGQIFLCFLIFCAMWNTKNKKYKFFKFLLLTLMLLVILFVINWILQDKVSSSSGEGSVSARSYDIQKCIQIGLDNLFFGKSLLSEQNPNHNYGFSNSLFALFADGGLYVLALYLSGLLFIPLYNMTRKKFFKESIVLLLYFYLFSITVSHFRYLTLLFVAYGISMCINYRQYGK